ncbi:hypothetical protein [Cedratvirus kamchatka]|uniref:Uncharacterized protein n=1 Tax=Cedratvirus kamchatka TaxID=2716914 RepID=A0A6G8MZ37_9VIRU|nr:hypothetical protein [Cedratvirus kamchatka]
MCEVLEFEIPIRETIKGTKLLIPGLEATVFSYRNSICPSRYGQGIRCFWEGDLEVVLEVDSSGTGSGKRRITLNDHDARKNNESYHRSNNYDYRFFGSKSKVVNKKDTFLIFEIEICPL